MMGRKEQQGKTMGEGAKIIYHICADVYHYTAH